MNSSGQGESVVLGVIAPRIILRQRGFQNGISYQRRLIEFAIHLLRLHGHLLVVRLLEHVPHSLGNVLGLAENIEIGGHLAFSEQRISTLNLMRKFVVVNQMMTHYCQLVILIDF